VRKSKWPSDSRHRSNPIETQTQSQYECDSDSDSDSEGDLAELPFSKLVACFSPFCIVTGIVIGFGGHLEFVAAFNNAEWPRAGGFFDLIWLIGG